MIAPLSPLETLVAAGLNAGETTGQIARRIGVLPSLASRAAAKARAKGCDLPPPRWPARRDDGLEALVLAGARPVDLVRIFGFTRQNASQRRLAVLRRLDEDRRRAERLGGGGSVELPPAMT